jgi:NADH:ubiquinone oxidoreductase subunit F (NADH-binding)/NADH:ubiquinone oxidoreductase subunit E
MPLRADDGSVNVSKVIDRIQRVTATSDLEQRIQAFPRQRTYLLPALHEVHEAYGWLPPEALETVGLHLRVPKSEVFGIASSFPDFLLEAPAHTERVCTGASCRALGGPDHADSSADCLFICGVGPAAEVDGHLVGRGGLRGAVPPVESSTLVQDGSCSRAVADTAHAGGIHVGCAGNCWQAPAVSHDGGRTWTSATTTWSRPEDQRLLRDVGHVDPFAVKPYTALEKAFSFGTDAVWQMVRDSGLRGRGGAYFPVGAKWQTARDTAADRKFLLVNAEEGEPGIYKDRHLLEGDPQRVVEGILIAAFGIGATNVVIFVNGEARLSHERLLAAIEVARRAGNVYLPLEVRQGAGGYVLGEETALINAIHGLRAEPLARPPFPAVSGLQSSPTVINNVESLTNLPDIILNGADWFRSIGTESTPGTKLVSLAGAVRHPGLYEVPLGTPLGSIVDDYGGGTTGDLGALLVGGPSGSILPATLLDTPLDVQPLQAVGGILGAGGIVALTREQCPVAAVRELVAYNSRESCGKCTPCREGTVRMLNLFDDIRHARANDATFSTLEDLNDILAFGSLCGLGQMAPNPVRALMRHFGPDVEAHRSGRCPAGVCA